MGRAIVREPQVFLMDEPLSNLDAKLRVQMRVEISKLQKELGVTTIYVTHDQIEAMTMGSGIAVMRKGVLQQVGPPQELYDHPANLFVATFIGSPAMNLFRARLEHDGDGLVCVVDDQQFPVGDRGATLVPYRGRQVAVGIRPEHLHDAQLTNGEHPQLRGHVQLVEALGSERLVYAEVTGEPVLTDEILEIAHDIDASAVAMLQDDARAHQVPIVARFDTRTRAEAGQATDIAIETRHLHFFDLETGLAI
jgi:multiple sugar transport system ATP-binding protein